MLATRLKCQASDVDVNNALNCLCGAVAFMIASSHFSNNNFYVNIALVILWA